MRPFPVYAWMNALRVCGAYDSPEFCRFSLTFLVTKKFDNRFCFGKFLVRAPRLRAPRGARQGRLRPGKPVIEAASAKSNFVLMIFVEKLSKKIILENLNKGIELSRSEFKLSSVLISTTFRETYISIIIYN